MRFQQFRPRAARKAVRRKTRRDRTAEQRIFAPGQQTRRLPSVRRYRKLYPLTRRKIAAHRYRFRAAVGMQQVEFKRVAVIKMPNFVVGKFMKQGEAFRFVSVQTDDSGSGR